MLAGDRSDEGGGGGRPSAFRRCTGQLIHPTPPSPPMRTFPAPVVRMTKKKKKKRKIATVRRRTQRQKISRAAPARLASEPPPLGRLGPLLIAERQHTLEVWVVSSVRRCEGLTPLLGPAPIEAGPTARTASKYTQITRSDADAASYRAVPASCTPVAGRLIDWRPDREWLGGPKKHVPYQRRWNVSNRERETACSSN